jgi:RNA polymerase sigma-70 factor (ECF subfamily)
MSEQEPRGNRQPACFEREFILGVRARDAASLERFFELFYDRVFGHVARLLGDLSLAEDVTHDIFLHLHQQVGRLDPDRDPTPWVFTVATNCVRDHWRSRRHREHQRQVPLADEHLESIAGAGDGPHDDAVRANEARIVQIALAQLAEADREIILLRDYEELDTAAIAAVLGARPDAVRQRHSRAVARLGTVYRRIADQASQER